MDLQRNSEFNAYQTLFNVYQDTSNRYHDSIILFINVDCVNADLTCLTNMYFDFHQRFCYLLCALLLKHMTVTVLFYISTKSSLASSSDSPIFEWWWSKNLKIAKRMLFDYRQNVLCSYYIIKVITRNKLLDKLLNYSVFCQRFWYWHFVSSL